MNQDDDFFDEAPCGCVVLTLDGTIVRSNAAFRTMVGCQPGKDTVESFQQVLSKAGAIYYESQFAPALRLRGFLKEVASISCAKASTGSRF